MSIRRLLAKLRYSKGVAVKLKAPNGIVWMPLWLKMTRFRRLKSFSCSGMRVSRLFLSDKCLSWGMSEESREKDERRKSTSTSLSSAEWQLKLIDDSSPSFPLLKQWQDVGSIDRYVSVGQINSLRTRVNIIIEPIRTFITIKWYRM